MLQLFKFTIYRGKMYTLEDDQETSSRLNKKEFPTQDLQNGAPSIPDAASVVGTAGTPDTAGATDTPDTTGTPDASSTINRVPTGKHRLSAQQVTGSFKQLTTPGQKNAGNPKVALAALAIACVAVFFTALDQTVVVTALPQIITDLHIPITRLDHAAWIISAYLLGFVVVMPLMGRVSDIYGRRRIFLLCLTIFGLGSILCGIAPILGNMLDLSFLSIFQIDTSSPGLILLITARLFQAIGGGAIVPVAMAIASDFYGQERRGLALGIIGAVTEGGGHSASLRCIDCAAPRLAIYLLSECSSRYRSHHRCHRSSFLKASACMRASTGLAHSCFGLALTCLSLD